MASGERDNRAAHRLYRARDWQHRRQLDELFEWWQQGVGLCALVGIGGAGKTAIADRFLQELPGGLPAPPGIQKRQGIRLPERLFIFSFYDVPNADSFFGALGRELGLEEASRDGGTPSYPLIAQALSACGPILLVLDGLEKVQDDGLRGAFGQITDGRLRQFVLDVADGYIGNVSVIITTRYLVYDVQAERSSFFRHIEVETLEMPAAVQLLRQRGVHGPDPKLERLANEVGLHALSVDLMGGFVAEFCGGDPGLLAKRTARPETESEEDLDPRVAAVRRQERRFSRVAQRYYEVLRDNDPAALALLQRICLFRLGADAGLLSKIFLGRDKVKISGRELAELRAEDLTDRLRRLNHMRLIEAQESQGEGGQRRYSIHPAVREGFLGSMGKDVIRRGHEAALKALRADLRGAPGRHLPIDPAKLDLLEEITFHAAQAGLLADAFDLYKDRMGGRDNLLWRAAAATRGQRICRVLLGRDLVGSESSGDRQDNLLTSEAPEILYDLAQYSHELGDLVEARQCLIQAIETKKAREPNQLRDNFYHNKLAIVLAISGRTLDAIAEAGALHRSPGHYIRGWLHCIRGQADEASEHLDNLIREKRASKRAPDESSLEEKNPYGNAVSLSGLVLARHLIRIQDFDHAWQITTHNLNWLLDGFGELDNEAPLCRLILAYVSLRRGELAAAEENCMKAVDYGLRSGSREVLLEAAMMQARLEMARNSRGLEDEDSNAAARAHVETGLRHARSCGYAIHHVDLVLLQVELDLRSGDTESAERALAMVLHEGFIPTEGSGNVALPAATEENFGYAWGAAAGHHLLGKAYLLRAAQVLGSPNWQPNAPETPDSVRDLVERGRNELERARVLRKKIRDPDLRETESVLKGLEQGTLTEYPLSKALRAESMRSQRTEVFVSYSHRDGSWLELLKTHLRPFVRNRRLSIWDDTMIRPGDDWRVEIEAAIDRARVAVLLVSPEFLASDFIDQNELPPLLEAARKEGVAVVWIPVSASAHEQSALASYQAAHDPNVPLDTLPKSEQNRALVDICKVIADASQAEA